MDARQALLKVYAAALAACHGERLVRDYLEQHPPGQPCHVVAIGKAASAMLQGALDALGDSLVHGLLITKYGHSDPRLQAYAQIELCESGHPLPDAQSLAAGARLRAFLDTAPADAQFIFLISGGASALVEHLPPGIGLDDLVRVNSWLLGSGLDIDAMNRVRKSLSAIKAGRLGRHLQGRACRNLMLSDVPGDDPQVIGSGLLIHHTQADIACGSLTLPDWLGELVKFSPELAEESAFASIESTILANNLSACRAARDAAQGLGFNIHLNESGFSGAATELGQELARSLCQGEPGCYIWGGESTVILPESPGRGGRNQALALSAAQVLAGRDGCYLLAAGTDGSDGPTEDAGALVDAGTLERGMLEGFDAGESLARADAGTFLEASGDLIQTGPTGTNVMDIVIGIKSG